MKFLARAPGSRSVVSACRESVDVEEMESVTCVSASLLSSCPGCSNGEEIGVFFAVTDTRWTSRHSTSGVCPNMMRAAINATTSSIHPIRQESFQHLRESLISPSGYLYLPEFNVLPLGTDETGLMSQAPWRSYTDSKRFRLTSVLFLFLDAVIGAPLIRKLLCSGLRSTEGFIFPILEVSVVSVVPVSLCLEHHPQCHTPLQGFATLAVISGSAQYVYHHGR